ncbi:MAG TPA: protein kinase [Kofleriaceae bacterium]
MVARIPARIGRYDLLTALATGGMGRIFLGRATGLGGFERKFVIKTLEVPVPPNDESDQAIAMFLDEARLLALLHHHHIASVFEVGREDSGRLYMALDYVDGYSAHDVFERAGQYGAELPLDFTLTVCSAVANGLHYAHTRKGIDGTPLGLVHRDVTPSNVMIGHDGAVQLIDFGIAMAARRKTKTQTGFVKGKIGYLSPEQVAGHDVDARTDVFALGILLYELSTLHRAFRDSSDLATMQRIKAGRVTWPSQLVANYPLELEIIVRKALSVDPRERFADADQMRRALEALGHRLHLVLGDAAIMEVMSQLFESPAPGMAEPAAFRASDPAFEWDSDPDLTVRRDPAELLAMMRAENASASERGRDGRDKAETALELPTVRPRKLRAATEAADLLIEQSGGAPVVPLASAETPSGVTWPAGVAPAEAPSGITRRDSLAPAEAPAGRTRRDSLAPAGDANPVTERRVIGASLVQARTGGKLRRMHWIGAIALVGIAAPVVYFLTRSSTDAVASAPSPPDVGPIAAQAPSPPPLPTTEPDAPPAPSKVRIRIVTHPADAFVQLDNKRLGKTPLDETVAAEPGKHVIKLRRKGYALHLLDVTLDADITRDISLTPQK